MTEVSDGKYSQARKVMQRLMNSGLVNSFERWRELAREKRLMKAKVAAHRLACSFANASALAIGGFAAFHEAIKEEV